MTKLRWHIDPICIQSETMTLRQKIDDFNANIAVKVTKLFGTTWAFYAFFLYGLLPATPLFSPYQATMLYWSNWVQLWSLPVLMVGQVVIGRAGAEQAQEMHDAVMEELRDTKATMAKLHAIMAKLGISDEDITS